jgi:hypothetical protein
MAEQQWNTFGEQVSALTIDAPAVKQGLAAFAATLDSDQGDREPLLRPETARHAYEALGKSVYQQAGIEPPEHGNSGTEAKATFWFEQFEAKVITSQIERLQLSRLRTTSHTVSNLVGHGKSVPKKLLIESFNNLVEYANLWSRLYAPKHLRKQTAYKDSHLDVIAEYRKRAEVRLRGLMGEVPANCYLERKVSFTRLRNDDDEVADDDLLGEWAAAQRAKAAQDAALQGTPTTIELLERARYAWLLGQAGIGKSLEAAQLAVRQTATLDSSPLSCCVTLRCDLLDEHEPSIRQGFDAEQIAQPDFDTFCALRGWRRYLILDGFDEKRCTSECFREAVVAFTEKCPDVHVLITSRIVTAVLTTFSWPSYELLEVASPDAMQYLVDRRGRGDRALRQVADQFDALTPRDGIVALLRIPFFLNAFAETLEAGDQIRHIGRCELVNRFIFETLRRQQRKGLQSEALARPTSNETLEPVVRELGRYAFARLTRLRVESRDAERLAKWDLLLRSDDQEFRQAEVRDYLAARHLFANPSEENFRPLLNLEDEHRLNIHGWLIELVNQEVLTSANKSAVLDRLWREDPVLVSLALCSEAKLLSLKLPEHPWEPYEIGLLKIMRGENPMVIAETMEIRDVRLSSPGEKLLHRLHQRDLVYLIRAVPNRRAQTRLEGAWTVAADPWAALMLPLSPIATQWLEVQPQASAHYSAVAYGLAEPPTISELHPSFAHDVVDAGVDTEVLVRLSLILTELRTRLGSNQRRSEQVDPVIHSLHKVVFGRKLSAKQLHRLLEKEARSHRMIVGITRNNELGQRIQRLIYAGTISQQPDAGLLLMRPLATQIPLMPCFGAAVAERRSFASTLWRLIVESGDVMSVPPIALAQALWTRIADIQALAGTDWFERWCGFWVERLSPFEAIRLQGLRFPFRSTPPGYTEAQGWLQAREAITIAKTRGKLAPDAALPTPQYTPEQEQRWVSGATLRELVGLLKTRVIDRGGSEDIFRQAIRRLEEKSNPQHWWDLVREGMVRQSDIPGTLTRLQDAVTSKPLAYELLEGVGWYDEAPSQRVVGLTTRCEDCALDTRVYLIRRAKVRIEDCWAAEELYIDEVQRKLSAGDAVLGLDGQPIERGGYLHGYFCLIFRNANVATDRIHFCHPGIKTPTGTLLSIEFRSADTLDEIAPLANTQKWRDGEVIMGFLWLNPNAGSERTLTVPLHKRGFHRTGYVFADDELQFAPNHAP